MNIREESLKKHFEWRGKIETKVKVPLDQKEDLLLAYTPGVAEPCLAIQKDKELSFSLTGRGNMVAVITDGTAVLGLGNIGPEAGMPVMEGKCALFKQYGNVDAVPICLKTTDTEEIIRTIKIIEGSFGGINIEDISAPRCFEIVRRLKQELEIPVFHDDQQGTAIVVGAALINALKIVNKKIDEIEVVISGAGAAGIAIAKFLIDLGVKNIIMCDIKGIICEGDTFVNQAHEEISHITNKKHLKGTLADAMKGADVFIGVSVGNVVNQDMVASMNKDAIIFTLANPIPEISRAAALAAGAKIVGTGSNEHPNQINNVLVFPGLFRGVLDVRATEITINMMIAAAHAIASFIPSDELGYDYIIPAATNPLVHQTVAKAVSITAIKDGVAKINLFSKN